MAAPVWTATYKVSSTSYTIDDIQSVEFMSGRRFGTEPFDAGSCTIVCRDPSNWPTPNPAMGRQIIVSPSNAQRGWVGRIVDIKINYGQVANMDEAVITCEGVLGSVGRNQLNAFALTQDKCVVQAALVAVDCSVEYAARYSTTLGSIASAQTYTGNALSLMSELMLTEVGRIAEAHDDDTGNLGLAFIGRYYFSTNSKIRVSDVEADWTATPRYYKYNEIQFKSSSENYFTKCTIQPQSLANQTSGTGKFALVQESLDYTTSQALSHAQYLLTQYASQTSTPLSITVSYAAQTTTSQTLFTSELLQNFIDSLATPRGVSTVIGTEIELKFRGTTYNGLVEGYSVVATPSDTTVTFYFTPSDQFNYLTLNSATLGTLGTSGTYPGNKLGF